MVSKSPGCGMHLPSAGVGTIDPSVALSELSLAVGIRHRPFVVVGVTWETYGTWREWRKSFLEEVVPWAGGSRREV